MSYRKHKCYECPLKFKSSRARNMHAWRKHALSKTTLGDKYIPSEYGRQQPQKGKTAKKHKIKIIAPVEAHNGNSINYCPHCGIALRAVAVAIQLTKGN